MKKEDIERDRMFYSNVWDDSKSKPLLSQDPNIFESTPTKDISDSASNASKKEAILKEKGVKLFNIAKNPKLAKYVDWKDSALHNQLKENTLTNYDKQDVPRYYKPNDVGKYFALNFKPILI